MMSRAFAVVRTLVIGTIFLSIWFYWLPRWFAHLEGVSLAPRNPWAWAVLSPGMALASWCAMEFALRGQGTPAPFDPPRRLVITGLYRWVRNPMYIGMALMLIGETLLLPQKRHCRTAPNRVPSALVRPVTAGHAVCGDRQACQTISQIRTIGVRARRLGPHPARRLPELPGEAPQGWNPATATQTVDVRPRPATADGHVDIRTGRIDRGSSPCPTPR